MINKIITLLILVSSSVSLAEKKMIQHPGAEKGLIRINPDGSYIYDYEKKPKSEAISIRPGVITAPTIVSRVNGLTYKDYYGSNAPVGIYLEYEWQAFQRFGLAGLQLGFGFYTDSAKGRFRSDPTVVAEEKYNLFIIPISLFGVYRFEYSKNQWLVPFVNAGVAYYALAEIRDDGKRNNYVGSPAVGGGGGIHLSLSALTPSGSFTLADEYGVSDLWFTLEARATAGLKKDLDVSNQSINAGITIDY